MAKRTENVAIGAELEEHVAQRLRVLGLDPKARRNPDSGNGNKEKADVDTNLEILGQHAHIECKHWSKHGMAAWIEHVDSAANMGHAEPILVYKLRRDHMSKARAIIPLETLLGLLVETQGVVVQKTVDVDSKEARYLVGKIVNATQKLIKLAQEDEPNPRLLQYARQEIRQAGGALEKALNRDYGE